MTGIEQILSRLPAGRVTFSAAEICEITGLSRSTIFRFIADGTLKSRKYGQRRLVLAHDLAEWINGRAADRAA